MELLDHAARSIGSIVPTHEFKFNFSTDDWPLSRTSLKDDLIAEAWELYIDGIENEDPTQRRFKSLCGLQS